MTIVIKNALGVTSVFESPQYDISKIKDMHPLIVSCKVYSGAKLIAKRSRKFPLFYKLVTFKSAKVQALLKKIAEAQERENTPNAPAEEN